MAAEALREQPLPLDEIPQAGTFRNRPQVSCLVGDWVKDEAGSRFEMLAVNGIYGSRVM